MRLASYEFPSTLVKYWYAKSVFLLLVIVGFVQVSQANLRKQPGSAPSLLKSDTVPTLVTDSNSNHFLIALTNHVTERQRADAPEAMNDNTLQVL